MQIVKFEVVEMHIEAMPNPRTKMRVPVGDKW